MDAGLAARFPFHEEASATLGAPVARAFAFLDDFHKLSAHMEKRSGMMMGSRMTIETDAAGGRAPGSSVRMAGRVMGLALSLEEVVTLREPPYRKAWETTSASLLVIGRYQLGFELEPEGALSRLRVSIDYELPAKAPWRWLAAAGLARSYARWCVRKMANDALAAMA